jgi:mannose/fructose/N-acetylgalactosamine-specific phosphotransferase system component IID
MSAADYMKYTQEETKASVGTGGEFSAKLETDVKGRVETDVSGITPIIAGVVGGVLAYYTILNGSQNKMALSVVTAAAIYFIVTKMEEKKGNSQATSDKLMPTVLGLIAGIVLYMVVLKRSDDTMRIGGSIAGAGIVYYVMNKEGF